MTQCHQCKFWEKEYDHSRFHTGQVPQEFGRCTLMTTLDGEPQNPSARAVACDREGYEAHGMTAPDFGCNAAVSIFLEDNESLRKAALTSAPENAPRLNQLNGLLACLEDCRKAVTASLNAHDPDREDAECVEFSFGETAMEEMISLIRTLPVTAEEVNIPEKQPEG